MQQRMIWLLVTGLILILAAQGFRWFIDHFEPTIENLDMGWSVAARRNPFLAAERFIISLDGNAASVDGTSILLHPPATDDTIIIKELPIRLSQAIQQRLLAWLDEGGHMIVGMSPDLTQSTPQQGNFLTHHFDLVTQACDGTSDEEEQKFVEIPFKNSSKPLKIAFHQDYCIQVNSDEAMVMLGDEGGTHLVQYKLGAGQLTILSDTTFLTNRAIGDYDHALFLATMTDSSAASHVWFIPHSHTANLLELLWQGAPTAMISIATLAAIFLWSLNHRSGPTLHPDELPRRNLLEHLDASADYLWRHGKSVELLHSVRGEIMQRCIERHPHLERLNDLERSRQIAALYRLDAATLRQTLYGECDTEQACITISHHLQSLRERL